MIAESALLMVECGRNTNSYISLLVLYHIHFLIVTI